MSVSKVLVPASRAVPAGSLAFGAGAAGVVNAFRRLLDGFAAHRAERARARDRARDRNAVIAMARRHESMQPSFAQDLYAAANHDR